MANSLLLLQQETADRLNLDYTVASNATRLTRWANLIQNDISSRYPWPWLITNGFIQTVTDITAGTVTTIAGSTSITGLGTAFTTANATNRYIQVANDTNWYEVVSVSGQVLTVNVPVVASAGGLTYILRTTYYDLPSNCMEVYDVRQTNTPLKLTCLGLYALDLYQPDINTTSNPTAYFLFGVDPSLAVSAVKQTQMGFFPCPDAVYNMQIRYLQEMTDLSATTDITIIPPQSVGVLLDGMEWLGNKFLNDPGEDACKEKYEYGLQKMLESANANGDQFPILQSTDNQQNQAPFLAMPGAYPSVNSGDY